jgi:hypothetical protein
MTRKRTCEKAIKSLAKGKRIDIFLLPLGVSDDEIAKVVDELCASQDTAVGKRRRKKKHLYTS